LSSRGAMVDATDKKGHLPPSAGNETIGSYASMTDDLSPSSKAVCLLLARWRLRAIAAASPLIVAELTFNLQCPLFQKTGLHAEAQLTWFDSCTWSQVDP
jgi:hypothetical protein